jgi:tetratricopeptide (TPR) repeat protein
VKQIAVLGLSILSACGGPSAAERMAEQSTTAGDALFNQGRYLDAIPSYESALQSQPGYPRALLRLGVSCERLGMIDRALQSYEQILTAGAESPETAEARRRRDRLVQLKSWDPTRGPKPKEEFD